MKTNYIFILSCLLFLTGISSAETLIEGQTITESQYWDLGGSPYVVTGNVTVAEEGALSIEPGVIVNFNAGVSLGVRGELFAEGNDNHPIVFQWSIEGVHWGGIIFYSSCPPTSVLSYCHVIGSSKVYIYRPYVTIANCVIRDGEFDGIYVDGSPTIVNNTIEQNQQDGIEVYAGSPTIENNLILNNAGSGISCRTTSATPIIRYNSIDSNGSAGISFPYSHPSAIAQNNIVSNNITGIYGGSDTQRGYNNVWNNRNDFSSTEAKSSEISVDPRYVDFYETNLKLKESSPCLVASASREEIGAYGNAGSPPSSIRTFNTTATTEGTITGNELWSGEISLTGSVAIDHPNILKIAPGTVVNCAPQASLLLYGAFYALGNEDEPIFFRGSEEGQNWGNLEFKSSSPPTSVLSYCHVTGSTRVYVWGPNVTITNCVIRDGELCGIYVDGSPSVVHNTIEQNQQAGIDIYAGFPTIENNLIVNNAGSGIRCRTTSSNPVIRYNSIDSNGSAGISFPYSHPLAIAQNNIISNNITGIYGGSDTQRGYNNAWNNGTNFSSTIMFATELSSDPVYIDSEYHLNINSPSKKTSVCGLEIGAYGSDSYCRELIDIELTSPNSSSIYETGDIEKIAWVTTNAQSTDPIVISMKRDSVPLTQSEPDGKNWFRFAENAGNDGQEYVVIQPGVAAADDWRFYVRHAPSGKYDAADCNFSVIGTSGHNSPTVKAPLDGQYIDPSDGVTLRWYMNNPYGEISDVRLLLEKVSSQSSKGGQVVFDDAIDVVSYKTFRDLDIGAWHHWRVELQFADGQATSVDSWFKTVIQGESCPDVAIEGLDRDIHATAGTAVALSGTITAQSEISVIALFVTKDAYGQIMHVHHAVETPESNTFDLSNFSIPGDELTDIEIYSFHIQIRTANCPEGYNDHGKITVTPGELKILPVIDQVQYRPFTVTVEAKDASGNPLDGDIMTVIVSDTLGYDSNTIYITLRQGTGTGEYVINTPVENVRLTATGYFGSKATSEPFNVEPAGSYGCNLQGVVKNDDAAIEGAVVSLYDDYDGQTPVFTSQPTDSNGKYQFDFIPCGKYYGEVRHDAWELSSAKEQLTLFAERPNKKDWEIESKCSFDKIPVLLVPGILGSTLKGTCSLYPDLPFEYADSPPNTNIAIHDPFEVEVIGGFDIPVGFPVGFTKLKIELQQAGYNGNCNVFEAPWDWRMPIHQAMENYLKKWIAYAKAKSGKDKVDIVAHSMGGLLARSYIQDENYEGDVNKLIFIGTPHKGAVNAYLVWNGEFPPKTLTEEFFRDGSIYEGAYKKLREKHKEFVDTPKAFIQTYIPSIKDLIPTFDFLLDENYQSHPIEDFDYANRNANLASLNEGVDSAEYWDNLIQAGKLESAIIFTGESQSTLKGLYLGKAPFSYEECFADPACSDMGTLLYHDPEEGNKWLYAFEGDGTVLQLSSNLCIGEDQDGNCLEPLKKEEDHGFLPKAYMDEIINFLEGKDVRSIRQASLKSQVPATFLTVQTQGIANPLLVSPSGNRAGVDPESGGLLDEIPNSDIMIDGNIFLLEAGNPEDGEYQLTLISPNLQRIKVSSIYQAEEKGAFEELAIMADEQPVGIVFDLQASLDPPMVAIPSVENPSDFQMNVSGDSVSLSWIPPEGTIAGYNVYRKNIDESSWKKLGGEPSATAASYVDNSVDYGNVYLYAVSAINSGGEEGTLSAELQTNDPDGDGLSSEAEMALGTDPNNADTDGDGLNDRTEVDLSTNPVRTDADGDGYSDKYELDTGSNPADFSETPVLEALFAAGDNEGMYPLTIAFTDLSKGDIDSYLWDFGDGRTAAEKNPVHEYETPGVYTVRLEVDGPMGTDTFERIDYIEVLDDQPVSPSATTGSAGDIKSTRCVLNGSLLTGETDVTWHFEYWTDPQDVKTTQQETQAFSETEVQVSTTVYGLVPETSYTFKLVVAGQSETSEGAEQPFDTTAVTGDIVYVEENAVCGNHTPCFASIDEGIGRSKNLDSVLLGTGEYSKPLTIDREVTVIIGWDSGFATLGHEGCVVLK